jgi:hypothetical protein
MISLEIFCTPANFKSLGKELKLEIQLEMLCQMNCCRSLTKEDKSPLVEKFNVNDILFKQKRKRNLAPAGF